MKKTLVLISLALVGLYAACQKSNKVTQSKFVTASVSNNPSVLISVHFGNPPQGGGACSGKGMCDAAAYTPGGGTTVNFQLSAANSNVLQLGFHLSDLNNNQSDQTQYFTNGGTYNFAGNFPLTDAIFTPLGLAPNAAIDTNTVDSVKVIGDSVTAYYTHAHN